MKKNVLRLLGVALLLVGMFYVYRWMTEKTIAILLYDDFTMLEVVGAYQTFPGLMMDNYKMKFVGKTAGAVQSSHIQTLEADYSIEEITKADILYIPGGANMAAILKDEALVNWVKTVDKTSNYTLAVGGGSLLLAETGVLRGKNVATHWYNQEALKQYDVTYDNSNYVKEGKYYTGIGASASIDMVLEVIGEISGVENAKAMQLFIEYDPSPPIQPTIFEKSDSMVQAIATELLHHEKQDTIIPQKVIAMMLYEGFTMLDITGPYQVFKALEPLGYKMKFVANKKGEIPSDMLLGYQADCVFEELKTADILFIPGGTNTPQIMQNAKAINWVKNVDPKTTYTTTVCTGSLVLAKAGLLENQSAACHWYAGRYLGDYKVDFSKERYTINGKYLTGAGVSSGIDLALLLVKELEGTAYAQAVQLNLGYVPNRPFDAGSPEKSSEETITWLSTMFASADKQYKKAKSTIINGI
ncbi:MAG: DJ-1/PfpI family protein [Aureispira sp.]